MLSGVAELRYKRLYGKCELNMKHYIEDKVVVITGGSSGFGLETARILLEMKAKVVITGRTQEKLDKAAAELASDSLMAVQADANSTEDWKKLIEKVIGKFERIDALVNNHGAGIKISNVDEMTDDDIQEVMDTNIISVMKGCREVINVMKPQNSGHIVNVSSGCAHYSWACWAVYTAAKAGMVGFTRCLHKEMEEWGGKATTFVPGAARTNFCDAAGIESDWLEGFPSAYDFARTLVHCIDVPDNCVIDEAVIWGTKQVKDMLNPY
jgi:NAD(P)-dependent dehydrogenase (short-subunit alcohol dehydrogenase family)